ncbi:nuclear receptor coactivator 7-like [Penaeus indicus]|uniref:nuclear receptor coactivator 7-like n=1 Tax=Penaeus indicus TaxID=29960 RepID=UPI00300CE1E5
MPSSSRITSLHFLPPIASENCPPSFEKLCSIKATQIECQKYEIDLGIKEESLKELIPKPATSCEDPPLYLCLRMGKPSNKRIPKSTPIMSYGKKRMRPEYWFSIPRNRSDELYNFFQLWAPDIYGELQEEEIFSKGFILVEEDTELWDEEEHEEGEIGDSIGGELKDMTKESWEVRLEIQHAEAGKGYGFKYICFSLQN